MALMELSTPTRFPSHQHVRYLRAKVRIVFEQLPPGLRDGVAAVDLAENRGDRDGVFVVTRGDTGEIASVGGLKQAGDELIEAARSMPRFCHIQTALLQVAPTPAVRPACRRSRWRSGTVSGGRSAYPYSCRGIRRIPSRNSSTATSAGAPGLSVPRSLKASNTRAGVDGRARDDLVEWHPEHQELRHHVRKIDDSRGARRRCSNRWRTYRAEALLHRALDDVPVEVIGDPVAEVEPDAAAAGREHLRQHPAALVENAVRRRRIHVRDDVAALEHREDAAHRREGLTHMDHHRQIEGRGGFLGAPERLEIAGAGHVVGQPCLDADRRHRDGVRSPRAPGRRRHRLMSISSPPGATPVRAMLISRRPRLGAAFAMAAPSSMRSAPNDPAST